MANRKSEAEGATPSDSGARRTSRRPSATPTPSRKATKASSSEPELSDAGKGPVKSSRASKAAATPAKDPVEVQAPKSAAKATGKRRRDDAKLAEGDNKKSKGKELSREEEDEIVMRLKALSSMNSLETSGEGINSTNDKGETYLHFAAFNAEPQLVKWLLEKGADCNMQDEKGRTALSRCASGDHHCVRILLQANADVDLADKDGVSPLHYASLARSEENVNLMLQYEAHVNTFDKTNGSSPLHDACFSGSLKCVKALVEAGAHVDLQTKSHKNKNKGAVALHYAAQQNRHDIVEYLIRQNANVNIQDARACTPLHYAAYTGSVDVVRVLLKNKADASKVNEQNQTAAQLMDSSPIISKHPKSDSSPSNPRAQIMQLLKPDSKKAPQNACVIC